MQQGSSPDQSFAGFGMTPLSNAAHEVLQGSQTMVSRGDLQGAAELLMRTLDNAPFGGSDFNASLALPLARILAAQGNLATAVDYLDRMQDSVDNHRIAAHIYCARAVELANQDKPMDALSLASRAAALAPSDAVIQDEVERLYSVLVPACVLAESGSVEIAEGLMLRALSGLIHRFEAAPNNLQIAHVIALLAEHCATKADMRALQRAIQNAGHGNRDLHQAGHSNEEHSEFDLWDWAIRCWVLLAYNDTYWHRWFHHLTQLRGEPEGDDVDFRALSESSLRRLEDIHKRLREVYRQPGSSMHDRARAERHLRYLVEIDTERRGAQALAVVMHQAPDLARSCGFVGPIAGVGLLAVLGRSVAVIQLQKSMSTEQGMDETEQQLRECLSPFSPMYTMDRIGLTAEVEDYCRQLADCSAEVRAYLCSILSQRAEAALASDGIGDARTICIEALRLFPESEDVLSVFAQVSGARASQALHANRTDFEHALQLVREDLAQAPHDHRLKRVVASVLRKHAQHLRDSLGNTSWNVSDARKIWSLQNEAWDLEPNPELARWTNWASLQLVPALLRDLKTATATTLEEAEATVKSAERILPGDSVVTALRLILLRCRVDWQLLDDERVALLRGKVRQLEALAEQVEQAWNLDHERDDEARRWTANRFAQLAEICAPDKGWPSSLAPYNSGLALVARGLRLVPGHSALMFQQAETLRLKATAIVYLEGGFYDARLTDETKRTVLGLFAQSWKLDDSVTARALAMAEVCDAIGEIALAEWYAYAALAIEPNDAETRGLLALIHARPIYDAAAQDADYAEQLTGQGRFRDAIGYLWRADQALSRVGYDPAWEQFVELHRVVRHSLEVLQRSGYR